MKVNARGLTFDVRVGGPADGPVVLLLHGFPQHSGQWHAVEPLLQEQGLRTVAPDQRGYSPGARPSEVEDYRLAECAADALAVLDELGAERAHVVGHDWGAAVAWHIAAMSPERTLTLTALSVPHLAGFGRTMAGSGEQRERSSYMKLFAQVDKAEEVLLRDDAAALRAIYLGADLSAEEIESYVAPMQVPGALTGPLKWYAAMSHQRFSDLPPVAVPTTFVWGDQDVAIGREAAESCAAHVTGDYRYLALEGVSHWISDQVPAVVAAEILARVRSV